MPALFDFGAIAITDGAAALLHEAGIDLAPYFRRHATGDWGDLDAEDIATNNRHVRENGRVMSQYDLPGGQRIWIITEADRSVTTVLLPEEH